MIIMKKLCALTLLLLFASNTVLAENWVFTAADQVNNTNSYNSSYPANTQNYQYNNANYPNSNDTYYGYADTADRMYNANQYTNPADTYSYDPRPRSTTPTVNSTNTYNSYNNYNSTYSANNSQSTNNGTFSDNHPFLALLGWGTLAVGATAVGWALSDSSDSRRRRECQKRHNCTNCCSHHGHYRK